MTTLYSCRHAGDQYRITKFDNDMNVEASYLCTLSECECPAGVRDTCRHRQMLHKFLSRAAVNTNWFYDYDRSGWVQTDLGEALSGSVEDLTAEDIEAMPDGLEKDYHHEIQDAAFGAAGTATGSVDTTGIGENWREIMRAGTVEATTEPVYLPGPITFDAMPPLPEGVTMISLDDPAELHNAIADAIGEPGAKLKPFRRGL